MDADQMTYLLTRLREMLNIIQHVTREADPDLATLVAIRGLTAQIEVFHDLLRAHIDSTPQE